jgi:hypothetical protein
MLLAQPGEPADSIPIDSIPPVKVGAGPSFSRELSSRGGTRNASNSQPLPTMPRTPRTPRTPNSRGLSSRGSSGARGAGRGSRGQAIILDHASANKLALDMGNDISVDPVGKPVRNMNQHPLPHNNTNLFLAREHDPSSCEHLDGVCRTCLSFPLHRDPVARSQSQAPLTGPSVPQPHELQVYTPQGVKYRQYTVLDQTQSSVWGSTASKSPRKINPSWHPAAGTEMSFAHGTWADMGAFQSERRPVHSAMTASMAMKFPDDIVNSNPLYLMKRQRGFVVPTVSLSMNWRARASLTMHEERSGFVVPAVSPTPSDRYSCVSTYF